MLKKLNLIGVIIGIVIMACSYFAFSFDVEINKPHLGEIGLESISAPQMESDKAYGGDAYTGIQNAAAATANYVSALNTSVEALSEAMMLGLGFCLMVAGVLIVVLGLKGLLVKDKAKAVETNETAQI